MDILKGNLFQTGTLWFQAYTIVTEEKLYLIICDDQRGTLGSNATLYQVLSHVFRFCEICDDT